MNEKAVQFHMCVAARYARAISGERAVAGRKMRAGKICNSCKHSLPEPHTPGMKRCEFCAQRHLVYMYFRKFYGWHCSFTTEARKKLPREFTFKNSNTLVELASRGNGLIDKRDREGFEIDLVIGKGSMGLRLSDEQCPALGGVL